MESSEPLSPHSKAANVDQEIEHPDQLAISGIKGHHESSQPNFLAAQDSELRHKDAKIFVPKSEATTGADLQAIDTIYPQLTHKTPDAIQSNSRILDTDEDDVEDDGITVAQVLPRHNTASPELLQRNRGAVVHSVGDEGVMRMHRFTLYETQRLYYIIGSDMLRESYRILKISRVSDPGELDVTEDDIVYTQKETQQIVNAIDEGNRATGGLKAKISEFWGLLGFVKFTGSYYMVVVTSRSHVAVVGGHYIERIEKTEMIPLTTQAVSKIRSEQYLEETRLLGIFGTVDLSKGFYFSRSYDITRTLQFNIAREREALNQGQAEPLFPDHNDMFIWNHNLLEPAKKVLQTPFDWCVAVTHGYIDQSALSIYWGRVVYITIIARRSRFFAGARYLKRGANDLGYVANDVETEQIVSEMRTQSFHAPGPELYANSLYTSYVQHRGSIPLFWAQDASGVSPKPDIHLNVVDPFFSAAALHFDDLFKRYGAPIYVLNLIKQKERTPREGKLGVEFKAAIDYLNQFLPDDKRILYHAFDMSRTSKSKGGDVIGDLEAIADDVVLKTGFFQNGASLQSGARLQNGVARTNCIDCLDRTNAAQFLIAKKALGYQLQALGIIEGTIVAFDSDAVTMFTNMWHDHGDTIAIQYGGSHLVNTMSTYRKINQWTSHSRDMVESLKRFYNNSFLDAQRQESYNLFLGTYTYKNGHPMLWDLSTDYYLHHQHPRSIFGKERPGYRKWFTPGSLEPAQFPALSWPRELGSRPLSYFDDYWAEYYRPLTLSSYRKMFAFKMHSNLTIINVTEETQGGKYDLSPFKVRTGKAEKLDTKERPSHARKKGVKVIAPSEEDSMLDRLSIDARLAADPNGQKPKPQELGDWLDVQQTHALKRKYTGIIKDSSWERASRTPIVPAMPSTNSAVHEMNFQPSKQEREALAFERMVARSLHPDVVEFEEYQRYVSHPASIQLVTSSETDYTKAPREFVEYIIRNQDPDSLAYAHAVAALVDDYSDAHLTMDERAEQSLDDYAEYIRLGLQDNPLTVSDEDDTGKRYKKYRSWITRGKSLFKQKYYVGGELV